MAKLKAIRLIPRVNEHFLFDGRQIKSVHGHGDGVGVALYCERSVVDDDFQLPKDQFVLFVTWEDFKQIHEALDISDVETLKLRKGKGWNTGPRPYTKKGPQFLQDFM